jgi:dipeptidyl aminopeptidase/acylaminoacyl peptidase
MRVSLAKWVCLVAALVVPGSAPVWAQSGLAGHWEGAITLPQAALQIQADFKQADNGWQGTIDIPQQNARGLALQAVRLEASQVHFELQAGPGVAVFEGKLEGDKISGNFSQSGFTFPFTLERKAAAAPAARAPLPEGVIPREVLFGNPQKASPQLSPDGTHLAYLAPDSKGVLNVWVRTVGKDDDQLVTADKKRGIRFFGWQEDSEHIIYVQDKDGDENWHLYQTNLKSKITRDMTPFDGVRAEVAAEDPRFPDELLVALNVRDRRLFDIYRLNLKNGALDLDTENPGDVAGWNADHDLQVRAAGVVPPDGGALIRIRENSKAPWKEFQRWGGDESFGGVEGFTPDNKGVLLISSVGANAARLLEVDLATGKSRVLAEDPQYDVGGVMVNPRTHKLEAVAFVRARREWTLVDKSLQADFDALKKARDGDFSVISRNLADKTWLVSYTSDDAPVSYYAYDRATKKATFLFTNRPALEKYKLAKMQPISFKARDGMVIYGYLTLPANKPAKNLPMVLYVHGGPWARDNWGLDNSAQWLANRGYAVLQVNYRGSTGYGKAYLNAGDREWAGKMHTDLLDAKNWVLQQGSVDPKKICIMGGSYGGYATLVGVAFTPDEFACGVDIVGPSNLVTLIRSIPPYWIPLKAIFDKRLGKVDSDEEFLKSRSPLFRAEQIKVPLLIGQGANDPRVNQKESDQIVAAMHKNGKTVEYIVFPDEGHGFARPENRMAFFAAAEQFLAKCLGGTSEPPSDAEAKLLASTHK